MTEVRFGWFTWDGEKAISTEHGNPLPARWQKATYFGTTIKPLVGKPWTTNQDTYEGILPLENGCSAWLFGTVHKGCWEVTMALYVPCPHHPDHVEGVRHCEFWAVPGPELGSVTQPSGCKGFYCDDCWHHKNTITADPGDEEEFWEVMREWGNYEVIHNPEIADHNEDYEFYEGAGKTTAARIQNGDL